MSKSVKIPNQITNAVYYHQLGITGKNITIAILDSGLYLHEDFNKNRILDFYDTVHYKRYPYDDCSHGTHVAGLIQSSKIGIAPQANLIPIKILDENGDGSVSNFIEGIQWILEHIDIYHIRIVNISIGGNTLELNQEQNTLNDWVQKLWDKGVIVCCSAGNNGPNPNSVTTPGTCKDVITVGSYDGKNFSSSGAIRPYITKPEIMAPGMHILSTKPQKGYQIKNGTSMSVPFISGSIALLLQLNENLTNEDVKLHLMNCARPIHYMPYYMQGAGAFNLSAFLSDFLYEQY